MDETSGPDRAHGVLERQGWHAALLAALLAAAFNHAYIWVHYHCTEKPDLRRIYGPGGTA